MHSWHLSLLCPVAATAPADHAITMTRSAV